MTSHLPQKGGGSHPQALPWLCH